MSNLSTFYPAPITAADLGLGAGSNATFGSVTTGAGTFTTLAANNGTLTASAPVLDLSQTWNNAAVTFRGVNWSFVETAAVSTSEVFRISAGAAGTAAIFNIRRDGNATFGNGVNVGTVGGNAVIAGQNGQWRVSSGGAFGFCDAAANAYGTMDTAIFRDAADTLAMRRLANPQTFRLYNTFTDASNYERGFMRWSSNVLQIGTEAGGTGSARGLDIVTNGFVRLSFGAGNTIATRQGLIFSLFSSTSATHSTGLLATGDGVLRLTNNAATDFARLQFGGETSSFPALKRSSTVLQARLANDSDFCPLQGQLRIHQNAVSETITATHTLTLFDAAGTAYKVPCVAA